MTKQLKVLEKKYAEVAEKEAELRRRGRFGLNKATLPADHGLPRPPPPADDDDDEATRYATRLDPAAFRGFGPGGRAQPPPRAPASAGGSGAYQEHLDALDADADGCISLRELKQATEAVHQRAELERKEYERQYREHQRELANGQQELLRLMQMLQQARAKGATPRYVDARDQPR